MVAQTVALPNIKKMFLPDPGYIYCDSDLAQADAQVVAWEAGDEKLKSIFRDPEADLHSENAIDIFGKVNKHYRALAKRGVHAANYVVSARTLSTSLGISLNEAHRFLDRWFTAHPGIHDWHQRISRQLQETRTITNKFGFRKVYFGRIEHILSEAVAWIPQSTVAIVINTGWNNLRKNFSPIDIRPNILQVHDSLAYQVLKTKFLTLLPQIHEQLSIPIPYDDPLTIPIGLSASELSWGSCVDMDWSGKFVDARHAYRRRKGVII